MPGRGSGRSCIKVKSVRRTFVRCLGGRVPLKDDSSSLSASIAGGITDVDEDCDIIELRRDLEVEVTADGSTSVIDPIDAPESLA